MKLQTRWILFVLAVAAAFAGAAVWCTTSSASQS